MNNYEGCINNTPEHQVQIIIPGTKQEETYIECIVQVFWDTSGACITWHQACKLYQPMVRIRTKLNSINPRTYHYIDKNDKPIVHTRDRGVNILAYCVLSVIAVSIILRTTWKYCSILVHLRRSFTVSNWFVEGWGLLPRSKGASPEIKHPCVECVLSAMAFPAANVVNE